MSLLECFRIAKVRMTAAIAIQIALVGCREEAPEGREARLASNANLSAAEPGLGISNRGLTVKLQPLQIKVKHGRTIDAVVRLENQSQSGLEIYNPFFEPRLMARQVAFDVIVLTTQGQHVTTLLPATGISVVTPQREDWIRLPPSCAIEAQWRSNAIEGLRPISELAPGSYLLEARAHAPLISGPPAALSRPESIDDAIDDPTYIAWRQSFPGPEICRSNRVELEILPRTGD